MNGIRRFLQQSSARQSWIVARRTDAVIIVRSGCGLKPLPERARVADKRRTYEWRYP